MLLQGLHSLPAPLLLISASILLPSVIASNSSTSAMHTTNTASGLTIEHSVLLVCKRPTQVGDNILVHYNGSLQSTGDRFDSSYDRNQPFSFKLGQGMVIAGWDEGLLDMCVGEERRLIIPPSLGYGDGGIGPIPGGATLIFETKLLDVVGVNKDDIEGKEEETGVEEVKVGEEGMEEMEDKEDVAFPTADIPPVDFIPPVVGEGVAEQEEQEEHEEHEEQEQAPKHGGKSGPMADLLSLEKNECRLLGPFALVVQGALGVLALLSLVFKRWRERPRRPLKIWFFDISKQILGTFLLHVANLGMSMFASGSFEVQGKEKELSDAATANAAGQQPNPCSFYLLNLAIDTTIGIPVLILLLKVLHGLFARTALANPPESIKSGHYGNPPRVTWWAKQSLLYFIGLLGMKLFVLFLFQALPWLGWVGDWALRWTEGNEALQIAFVMFIFPVCMNAIQYYIIDGVIKEGGNGADRQGFERVAQEESEEGDGASRRRGSSESSFADEDSDVSVVSVTDEDKDAAVKTSETLLEANPTSVPAYDEERDGESSEGRK